MKLPDIDYARPTSLDSAVRLLADVDARILAGGQSLIPMMAYRLATPSLLVDIARIPGLDRIGFDADGVTLGARVRWRDIENEPLLATGHPLLCAGVSHIAHYQIRNRGTVGGSLAHADPAADWPPVMLALQAELDLTSARGRRRIAAAELITGVLTTALEPDEIIEWIRIPRAGPGLRWGHYKISAKPGDFADSLAVVVLDRERGEARAVLAGRSQTPMLLPQTARVLAGSRTRPGDKQPAISAALDADLGRGGIAAGLSPHELAIHRASVGRAAREALVA